MTPFLFSYYLQKILKEATSQFDDRSTFISIGFNAWGGVFFNSGNWYAVGGKNKDAPKILSIGQHITRLAAADDWLNRNEDEDAAHKTRRWLQEEPTEKQISGGVRQT